MFVGHTCRRSDDRMNDRLLAIHADVRLGSEIPLIALLGLMHLGVTFAAGILRRTGRMDDGRIHDGAGRDADARAFQVAVHRVQHLTAQIVRLKQVAETKDRSLVRRRGYAQIDSGKAAQHGRLIERLFHARIRQAEPLLQKVSSQHNRQPNRLPTVACLGVMRLNQRPQLAPRNHLLHVVEEKLPLALAAMLFKAPLGRQRLLKMRHSLHIYSLFKYAAGYRLVQRFPSTLTATTGSLAITTQNSGQSAITGASLGDFTAGTGTLLYTPGTYYSTGVTNSGGGTAGPDIADVATGQTAAAS